jgi:hypothetical protein
MKRFHSMKLVRRHSIVVSKPRRPRFLIELTVSDGSALKDRLLAEGLDPGEVMMKYWWYWWPRYAPPRDSGIRSKGKSESLSAQFERLIAMHREAPSRLPMPVASVRSPEGEFAGYILEYVEGLTLRALIADGMLTEARRQVEMVEQTMRKLHAKGLPHGDLNPSNIIAADDGRTVLIDPVSHTGPGTALQDTISIAELRQQTETSGQPQRVA